MAYSSALNGILNVWAGPAAGPADWRPVTREREHGIRDFLWAWDNVHLVYAQDEDGDERTRLFALNVANGNTRNLTKGMCGQARVIAGDQGCPGALLVGVAEDRGGLPDAYRVELATGHGVLVERNPGFRSWLTGPGLSVKGGVVWPAPDGGLSIAVRADDEHGGWRTIHTVPHEDAVSTRPICFAEDGQCLLVISSLDAPAARLLLLSRSGPEGDVLYEDPHHDVISVAINPRTRRAEVAIVQRARAQLEILDPAVADDIERLNALDNGDVSILSRASDDCVWLLQTNSPEAPAAYWTYDRRAKAATRLFSHNSALEGRTLASMQPFTFRARDDLAIQGYLTWPPGSDRRRLPTVVVVHGGPWARVNWGFRGETQWLANRGYLVVDVNYRGSSGYGKDFLNAGDREWGGAMQTDLVDAVTWAVGRGYADPARIGIYGASYGGYAALAGVTFTPDVFACAVALAGPSNLNTFIAAAGSDPMSPIRRRLRARVGDPETEREFLWTRSPLSRVGAIRAAILICQGARDPRVPHTESEQMVAELKRRGIPHEYLLFPDEGHGITRQANRTAFYGAAEAFLATHLGGRRE